MHTEEFLEHGVQRSWIWLCCCAGLVGHRCCLHVLDDCVVVEWWSRVEIRRTRWVFSTLRTSTTCVEVSGDGAYQWQNGPSQVQ